MSSSTSKKNNLYLTLINVNVTDKSGPKPRKSTSPQIKHKSGTATGKPRSDSKKSSSKNHSADKKGAPLVTQFIHDQSFYHVIKKQINDYCKQKGWNTAKGKSKKAGKAVEKKDDDEEPSCSKEGAKEKKKGFKIMNGTVALKSIK